MTHYVHEKMLSIISRREMRIKSTISKPFHTPTSMAIILNFKFQRMSLYITGGVNVNYTAPLENNLAISYT